MARCPKCKTTFRVPEDESPNEHGCPKCGFEPVAVKHLCDTCKKEFPTCDGDNIVWGIDIDPSARGAAADTVVKCDGHQRKPITDGVSPSGSLLG